MNEFKSHVNPDGPPRTPRFLFLSKIQIVRNVKHSKPPNMIKAENRVNIINGDSFESYSVCIYTQSSIPPLMGSDVCS